ncbi:MAG TPA: type II toxin-antitoxin system HicB family antitoxin [Candidatus Limnocylindrales bacterium]|nr:type II toxin-antitoxin system HicB family antitoxin [Candidatus Limnocylindrales bacterium]
MMEYKGYYSKVAFDEDAYIFHGQVINIKDVITFEGITVDELKQAFQDSVDDYLEFCSERGEDPDKPYSGRFVVRIDPELHKSIAIEARGRGKSLNALVNEILSKSFTFKAMDHFRHQADDQVGADLVSESSFTPYDRR